MVNELKYHLEKLEAYAKHLFEEAQVSDLANEEYVKVKEQIRNLKSLLKGKE